MKKRMFWIGIFIIGFVLLQGKTSESVGISPPRIERVFSPNFEENITVNIINTRDEEVNMFVGVDGDISDFIGVSEQEFKLDGRQSKPVILSVKLPAKLKPGIHTVSIIARELPVEKKSGITAFPSIKGELRLAVPYPGKFVELQVEVQNKNRDEPIEVKVLASNRGTDEVGVLRIEARVVDEKGKFKEQVQTTRRKIGAEKNEEISILLSAEKYDVGIYHLFVKGVYDGIQTEEMERVFQVGHLFVNIVNVTSLFKKDKIQKVSIEVESGWNNRIDGLYAEMVVFKEGKEMKEAVKSPSVSIDPWERKIISFFWDTSGIEEGVYEGQVILYYDSKTTVKKFPLIIEEEKKGVNGTIMMVILICVLLFFDMVWLRGVKKKDGWEKGGKNRTEYKL